MTISMGKLSQLVNTEIVKRQKQHEYNVLMAKAIDLGICPNCGKENSITESVNHRQEKYRAECSSCGWTDCEE